MVVGDIIDGLKAIKEIIVTLKKEADALEKIKNDNVGKVITFSHSLYAITDVIDNILEVIVNDKEVGDVNISLISTLKHKVEGFSKFLITYREWTEGMEGNCCLRCKTVIKNSPSKMDKRMNEEIDKCQDINEKIIEIQDKTIGSASKINNKTMKKVWIHGLGKNQLNDTQLHIDTLATNIFTLLSKEYEIKNKDLYRDIIYSFLNKIDNISITPPDSIIQINEINLYIDSNKINSSSSLKELLNIKKDVKDEKTIDISVSFEKMKIDSKSSIEMPAKDERYGSGFNNKKACTFKVPNLKEGEDVFSVIVECNACDQGWGGTGHAQIRYQINNGDTQPSINIWRTQVKDNNYKMTLTDVKSGDEISIWMYCPAWSGWECHLNSVKASVILC